MPDIGFFEVMIILAIAVIVIGPANLPELVRAVGRGWGEFQKTLTVKSKYSSMRDFRYFQFMAILSFAVIVLGPQLVVKLVEAIQILLNGP